MDSRGRDSRGCLSAAWAEMGRTLARTARSLGIGDPIQETLVDLLTAAAEFCEESADFAKAIEDANSIGVAKAEALTAVFQAAESWGTGCKCDCYLCVCLQDAIEDLPTPNEDPSPLASSVTDAAVSNALWHLRQCTRDRNMSRRSQGLVAKAVTILEAASRSKEHADQGKD